MKSRESKDRFSAVRLLIELCPLPTFLLAYVISPGPGDWKMFIGISAFIAATLGATLAKVVMRRPIRALSWISAVLVLVLGSLTLWLGDETFIKIKPTLHALAAAGAAGFALLTGRPWMRSQFANDRHLSEVDETGRRKLAWLILSMSLATALVNELIWRNTSTLFWIGFQIWGGVLLFVLFAAAGTPIIARHWSGQCKVTPCR